MAHDTCHCRHVNPRIFEVSQKSATAVAVPHMTYHDGSDGGYSQEGDSDENGDLETPPSPTLDKEKRNGMHDPSNVLQPV